MRTVVLDSDDAPFQESQMINSFATVIAEEKKMMRTAEFQWNCLKDEIPLRSALETAQTTLDNRATELTYSINQMQLNNCAK